MLWTSAFTVDVVSGTLTLTIVFHLFDLLLAITLVLLKKTHERRQAVCMLSYCQYSSLRTNNWSHFIDSVLICISSVKMQKSKKGFFLGILIYRLMYLDKSYFALFSFKPIARAQCFHYRQLLGRPREQNG